MSGNVTDVQDVFADLVFFGNAGFDDDGVYQEPGIGPGKGLERGAANQFGSDASTFEVWMWWAGILVLIMHLGFAFLEAGSVQQKNALNVMFKNIITITLGGVCYYLIGYGIFSAGDPGNLFSGGVNFLLLEEEGRDIGSGSLNAFGSEFFFQFAFAATAATIVSGAVAGRITLPAYCVVVVCLTTFIYPPITHWVWASTGWLTQFFTSQGAICEGDPIPDSCPNAPVIEGSGGLKDFAGSGVVHMTGGFAALAGVIVLGPRNDAMVDGELVPPAPSSTTLMAIGVFVLWIGWYGFNCGSTLTFAGYASGMGHAAICTTLAPSTAVVTAMIFSKLVLGYYDVPIMLNAALAGLVGITASANVMNFGWTVFIGFTSFFVYYGGVKLLIRLKLDDPVGAIPVHGFCGFWGVIMQPINTFDYAGNPDGAAAQAGMQFVGVVVIGLWSFVLTFIVFFALATFSFQKERKEKFLRATDDMQEKGLDSSEHGGEIYKSF